MDRPVYNAGMASVTLTARRARAVAPPPLAALAPRDRILRAAHDLFYRDGIRATGIDRVIAESGVAKVTFYRQFASKDDLVLAFLDHRHERWMAWFVDALARHGGTVGAIVPALAEWLGSAEYRGCAFLNSVGELGPVLPGVLDVTRRHKQDMTEAIAGLMRASPRRDEVARAIAMAVDGAIVQAQFLEAPGTALETLQVVLRALRPGNA